MKIALYGKKNELKARKERIQNCFRGFDEELQIDEYAEEGEFLHNVLGYDFVCLTDRLVDMITEKISNKVVFEWGKKIRTCNLNDIYFAEADLKNTHIWFRESEMLVHLPFSVVEQILCKGDFIKTHRSFLVNCIHVQNMNDNTVGMTNGREVPLSKYRAEKVRKQYIEYIENRHNLYKL